MTKWILLLVGIMAAGAARAEPMRAKDVIHDCNILAPDTDKFFQCKGYIQGILDGFYRIDQSLYEESNTHEGFFGLCLPVNGVRGDTVVDALKSRVELVPKDAGRMARTVIFSVLQDMYPCREKK